MINKFKGEFGFLSNPYSCQIRFEGFWFNSVENAFQAAKTEDIVLRRKFRTCSWWVAKKMGKSLKLRRGWEDIKEGFMLKLVRIKFTDTELREKLLNTGDQELVEGNYWHDNIWGDCTCPACIYIIGQNLLGKILMKVREELRND